MKINVNKVKKGKAAVSVVSNSGKTIGTVMVSKSLNQARSYLETSKGPKSVEFKSLLEKARVFDKKIKAIPKEVSISHKKGITHHIRAALEQGVVKPKELFAYLDKAKVAYNKNSAYVILWEEKKRLNLI